MSELREDLNRAIRRRAKISEAIDEHKKDRNRYRRRKQDTKDALEKKHSEERERELERRLAELVAKERAETKRINELQDRDDELHRKAEQLRHEIQEAHDAAQPNFNGHPSNVNDDVKAVIVVGQKFGNVVTSTTDGSSHASTSYHYTWNNPDGKGGAVDMGDDERDNMVAFQKWCWEHPEKFREVFGPDNGMCVKNGVRISIGEGTALENAHDNHDHIAPYPGAFS